MNNPFWRGCTPWHKNWYYFYIPRVPLLLHIAEEAYVFKHLLSPPVSNILYIIISNVVNNLWLLNNTSNHLRHIYWQNESFMFHKHRFIPLTHVSLRHRWMSYMYQLKLYIYIYCTYSIHSTHIAPNLPIITTFQTQNSWKTFQK